MYKIDSTWRKRLTSLMTTVDAIADACQQASRHLETQQGIPPSSDVSRFDTLYTLSQCLRAFSVSQFDFFENGFDSSHGIHLEPSLKYPKEYVMRITLDQISYDLSVLKRAYVHRVVGTASEAEIQTLNQADSLAYRALKPAIDLGLLEEAAVITYFQKANVARIIPYAPVVLIGISYTSVSLKQDLLAIPHEVGHYVFRYGIASKNGQKLGRFSSVLQNERIGRPLWLQNWTEEIFADVYGCLIAGPAIALSIQEMMFDNQLSYFTHDDGKHPPAMLRPYIYIYTLEYINNARSDFDIGPIVEKLKENWQNWLYARGNPDAFFVHRPNVIDNNTLDKMVGVEEACHEVQKFVHKLLDTYLGESIQKMWHDEKEGRGLFLYNQLSEDEGLDAIYRSFELLFEPEKPNTQPSNSYFTLDKIPELSSDGQTAWLESPNGKKQRERQIGDTGLWIDAIKQAAAQGAVFKMPAEAWMVLLDTSGWSIGLDEDVNPKD